MEMYRIVFMGMTEQFTLIPFQALVDAEVNMAGLVLPRPRADSEGPRWLKPMPPPGDLPMLSSPVTLNAAHLAAGAGIPILEVGSLKDPRAFDALDSLAPDLICAACFPRLLPGRWLDRPRFGCLNLHPSLLPAYRGRDPLVDQFKAGERHTGVTLHFMDEGVDTGDIVSQAEVPFPDGITLSEAESLTAQAGAQLLLEALRLLPNLPRRPQE
jgi:methionyl-tRNA formyltransferase